MLGKVFNNLFISSIDFMLVMLDLIHTLVEGTLFKDETTIQVS